MNKSKLTNFYWLIKFSMIFSLVIQVSCKTVNNKKLITNAETSPSTKLENIDSTTLITTQKNIEISRINRAKNEEEIQRIFDSVSHFHLSIAGGVAGYFSPQFAEVNKKINKNTALLLDELNGQDILTTILSIFALEKHKVVDERILLKKQQLSNMNAILEYQFCCTDHQVYLFREIFDTTTNSELKDLIYSYID